MKPKNDIGIWTGRIDQHFDELVLAIKDAHTSHGFGTFGLRSYSGAMFSAGAKLPDSFLWILDGEETGVSLGGVSTVGIKSLKKEDIKRSLHHLSEYTSAATQVVLVGGKLSKKGQDLGESLIKDGIALRVWKL